MPTFGKYNYAICRRIDKSAFVNFEQDSLSHNSQLGINNTKSSKKKKTKSLKENSPNGKTQANANNKLTVDYETAMKEMDNFIATLRMLNVDVIQLCPDETLGYEALFAGDTAVSINGLVLACRPRNRLEEVQQVIHYLKKELNMLIIEIEDESAFLNGGDVLWTGREIFVGLSHETNEAGARAVANAFPELSVTPVKVPDVPNLRLKSYVTMAGPDILCMSKSQEAELILRRMEREASYNYKIITVEDEQAANVMYLNGTLLHRNDFPSSVNTFQEKIDYHLVPVAISELCLNYPNHGLDSFCILLRKTNKLQTIV